MPLALTDISAVVHPVTNKVYVAGGKTISLTSSKIYDVIYELNCISNTGCSWTILSKEMSVPRSGYVALLVNDFNNQYCNETIL